MVQLWKRHLQVLLTLLRWSLILGVILGLAIGLMLVASRLLLTGRYQYPLHNLPEGRTTGNFPTLGASDAPIRLELFTTFANVWARDEFQNGLNNLAPEIASDKIQVVYYPLFPIRENEEWRLLGGTSGATISAVAAMCAQEQGRFWAYADFLYTIHGMFGDKAFLRGRLLAGADALGLNMTAFTNCMDNPQTLPNYRLPAINFDFSVIPFVLINNRYFGNPQGHILWYYVCSALLDANLPSESCVNLPESLLIQGLN
jgi:hypothetical protein